MITSLRTAAISARASQRGSSETTPTRSAPSTSPPPGSRQRPHRERPQTETSRRHRRLDRREGGYAHVHATKPTTLCSALSDSPAGLAAWIAERSSPRAAPVQMAVHVRPPVALSTLTLYSATGTIGTSLLPYSGRCTPRCSAAPPDDPSPVQHRGDIFGGERIPFPKPPRELAQRYYTLQAGRAPGWRTLSGSGRAWLLANAPRRVRDARHGGLAREALRSLKPTNPCNRSDPRQRVAAGHAADQLEAYLGEPARLPIASNQRSSSAQSRHRRPAFTDRTPAFPPSPHDRKPTESRREPATVPLLATMQTATSAAAGAAPRATETDNLGHARGPGRQCLPSREAVAQRFAKVTVTVMLGWGSQKHAI